MSEVITTILNSPELMGLIAAGGAAVIDFIMGAIPDEYRPYKGVIRRVLVWLADRLEK